jgi:hypothetical protein
MLAVLTFPQLLKRVNEIDARDMDREEKYKSDGARGKKQMRRSGSQAIGAVQTALEESRHENKRHEVSCRRWQRGMWTGHPSDKCDVAGDMENRKISHRRRKSAYNRKT